MQAQPRSALRHSEVVISGVSSLLALFALLALPWPGLPMVGISETSGRWLLVWAALEGAFLTALLPGLLAGTPAVVRATLRDGQISVAGRASAWLAGSIGLALSQPTGWAIPAYLLGLLALAGALTVAIGWGPFGAVPGHARSAAERAIDSAVQTAVGRARLLRSLALQVATFALLLPLRGVSPIVAWLLLLGMILLFQFALRRFEGLWPRMTLQAALRFCWSRVLPLAVAAIIYVVYLSWA